MPWAAALFARSQLLEGAGGPYVILRQCTALCLLVDTSYEEYHKNVSLDTLIVSFKKKFLVFELLWILLVFAFWPHQKTGLEASEHNS